jgi:hypothetical protein
VQHALRDLNKDTPNSNTLEALGPCLLLSVISNTVGPQALKRVSYDALTSPFPSAGTSETSWLRYLSSEALDLQCLLQLRHTGSDLKLKKELAHD